MIENLTGRITPHDTRMVKLPQAHENAKLDCLLQRRQESRYLRVEESHLINPQRVMSFLGLAKN